MQIKKRYCRHTTTQYTVQDASNFNITEVLSGEGHNVVFVYDEDGICVAMFRLVCNRGIYAWGGQIWCVQEHEYFDEDELNIIASYIIEEHNKHNNIFDEETK